MRHMVLTCDDNNGHSKSMPKGEVLNLALNMDYLWRCILFSHEHLMQGFDKCIEIAVNELDKTYEQKYFDLESEMEVYKEKYEKLQAEVSGSDKSLQTKLKNCMQEKDRMRDLAEARMFDLNALVNKADNQTLKGTFLGCFIIFCRYEATYAGF